MRVALFVDGFNLYYGALKGTSYRWLDVFALGQNLYPGEEIVYVKYFTARVSGQTDPDAPRRQAIYFKALNSNPSVSVHLGSFLSKSVWRPLINLPIADRNVECPNYTTHLPKGNHVVDGLKSKQILQVGEYPKKGDPRARKTPLVQSVICEVHTMEEKGSDVNLASHLLNDAWNNSYDRAAVISNDTDLQKPIEMVVSERNKKVDIVCPNRDNKVANKLSFVSTGVKYLRPPILRASQFQDPVVGTQVAKPIGW